MILALRPQIVTVLLGLFALWPAPVNAGMTVEELWTFAGYKAQAAKGIAESQFNVSCCYYNGKGVAKDQVQAVEWCRKSAEQGFAAAQCNLGYFYAHGEGVAKDLVEAVKWYRKSAVQGFAEAQYNLGCCYDRGEGLVKNSEQAVMWYLKAAEQGDAQAQYNLGWFYAKGESVLKDEIEAYAYWNLSGIKFPPARENLAILEKKISPDARLLGQQRARQLQKEIQGKLESADNIRKVIEKMERSKGA